GGSELPYDAVYLALAIGADGVHLGGSDEDLGAARARLGNSAIIGATCHASLTRAAAAARAGADYLSFGRFFPSRTKPSASAAQPAVLGAAKGQFALPIVAIGGVNPHNGRALLAAGADWLCASHAVFGAADPATAAAMLAALFFQEEDRDRS
ncbi:MAG: thiamine phosphate synthase, partial [Salinisphaera sp.]|nr:thiamine phosphate synthase [Salinisphaera sp.]